MAEDLDILFFGFALMTSHRFWFSDEILHHITVSGMHCSCPFPSLCLKTLSTETILSFFIYFYCFLGFFFFQSCLLTVTVVKNLFLNRKLDIVHETLKKLVITFLEKRVQFPMTVDTPRTYHSIQI